ncbi:MAG: hypothetical protein FWD63_06890 [Propionibacteriaceae bacterium]|nr:hypothetical protein [Propionibacteriaceae bacterium]
MCYFITVVMSGLPVAHLNELALARHMVFTECHNKSVATQLRPDEIYLVRDSLCDCGTELGSKLRTSKPKSHHPAGPSAEDWLALIQETMNAGAKRIGLLYHWYLGDVTSETVAVARRPIPVDFLTAPMLLDLPEDTLVMATRTGHTC